MNKKKTTAILSLSFAFAVAFGGSTLVDNSGNVSEKLQYNLDKLEAFSTCTDWTNPDELIFGDEIFLGYDNQNYYYYTPKTTNKPNFNTNNQQKTNEQTNTTQQNNTQNLNKTQSNSTQNLNSTQQNTNANQTNRNTTTNQNRGKIDTMQRAPKIDTYNNQTNDYGVDNIRNNTNGFNNSNNNLYNTNGNYGNNANQNVNNNVNNNNMENRTYDAPNGTTATVAANEVVESKSMLSNFENQFYDVNNQLKTQCASLKQNIQSLRANLQTNTNYTNTQQKGLRAYNRILGKVAHKLSKCQMELLDASSRLYILASDQTNNSDAIDAQILEIKSIMTTQIALYDCANQALSDIKQLVLNNDTTQNDVTRNTENTTNDVTRNQTVVPNTTEQLSNTTQQPTRQIENNQAKTMQNKDRANVNDTNTTTANGTKTTKQYQPVENNQRSNQTAPLENYNQNSKDNFGNTNTNLSTNNTMPKLPANQQ